MNLKIVLTVCSMWISLPWAEVLQGDAVMLYNSAVLTYDSASLSELARNVEKSVAAKPDDAAHLLLAGLVAWRLELISFCKEDKAGIQANGRAAINYLEKAEKAGADSYVTTTHRALACQLMATLGIGGGTRYGPQAASELKRAKTINASGYYTQLVEAINYNQAPSFAGGNTGKALEMLKQLAAQYPDSIDVRIHLADAHRKNGREDDALALLLPIVKSNQRNLLALKVLQNIRKK